MNDLAEWTKVIEESRKLRVIEEEEFNKKLPEPDSIYYEDDNYMFGYWKTKDGVIQVRKWPNGKWDRHSCQLFSHEMINAINIAYNKKEK